MYPIKNKQIALRTYERLCIKLYAKIRKHITLITKSSLKGRNQLYSVRYKEDVYTTESFYRRDPRLYYQLFSIYRKINVLINLPNESNNL